MNPSHLLLTALLLTACAKKSGFSEPASSNQQTSTQARAPYVKYREELRPVPDLPDRYTYRLEWVADAFYESYSTQSALVAYEYEKQKQTISQSNFEFSGNGGEFYKIRLIGHKAGQSYLLFEKKIRFPKDFVLQNDKDLTQSIDNPSGRIFIPSSLQIHTQGKDLTIIASELLIEGELFIDTLPSGTPNPSQAAQSGGKIHIESKSLKGKIKILSRGQQGAPGVQGMAGNPGKDGNAGATGVKKCGKHPNGIKDLERDGEDGQNGGPGGKGGQGAQGGNTALVFLRSSWSSPSQVEITQIPGSGGEGGAGGRGGQKGKGGAAGEQTHDLQYCRRGMAGADGQDGPSGEKGEKGKDGLRLGYCLINEKQFQEGECERIHQSPNQEVRK